MDAKLYYKWTYFFLKFIHICPLYYKPIHKIIIKYSSITISTKAQEIIFHKQQNESFELFSYDYVML